MCRKNIFSLWAGARLSSLPEVVFYAAASVLVFTVVTAWMLVVGAVALLWRALPWVVGAAALVVILLRAMEVMDSKEGLWPSKESIGADAAWEGGEW